MLTTLIVGGDNLIVIVQATSVSLHDPKLAPRDNLNPSLVTQPGFFGPILRSIFLIIIISLSISLTGLSLEMYIFHFEAIYLSTHISGSRRPIFTNLDLLKRPWPIDGS
jgi:hypothetical protein